MLLGTMSRGISGGGFRALQGGVRRIRRALKPGATKARIVVEGPLAVIYFNGPVRRANFNADELRSFIEKLEVAAQQLEGAS
jgi:hypothetical protein